jgi:heme-degrading monooxygenase HmoA
VIIPVTEPPIEEHRAIPSPIRLLTFRPLETPSVVDRDLIVGRRTNGTDPERIVVSVWEASEPMEAWAGGSGIDAVPERSLIAGIEVRALEVLALAAEFEVEQATPPSVLRVFRGVVRDGELDAYVDEAHAGTLADDKAGYGPHALYLGVDPPNRFLTVSLWADWSSIEAATGGDIRRPVATRHADRLTGGNAEHYEVVSDISGMPEARVSR